MSDRHRPAEAFIVLAATAVLLAGCRGGETPQARTASEPRPSATTTADASKSSPAAVGGAADAEPSASAAPDMTAALVRRLLALTTQPAHAAPLTGAAANAAMARVAGSPGLVVCYPVTAWGAAEEQADFGAACGLYLALHVGGRPEAGQTPLLTSAYRAAREVGQPSLRVASEADGAKVAAATGATHFAIGTIIGDAAAGTLTYRLYRAGSKNGAVPHAVGAPLTATGTRAAILKALPNLAGALRARLLPALAKTPLPTAPSGSPEDMTRVGDAASAPPASSGEEEAKFLTGAWQRVPEAGVLALSVNQVRWNLARVRPIVNRLLAAYPDNPLVLGQIGYMQADALLPHEAAIRAAAKRHPNSYALAHTEVWLSRVAAQPDRERVAAARAVRNAPRNPDAYLSYGATLSNAADAVRKGKFFGRMSADEVAFVEQVYPQWFAAVRRATDLDPNHGVAWLRVAQAGTFVGARKEAQDGYDNARRLMGPSGEVFGWGLQMFHPKWGGDPDKLRAVAEDAARASYPNPYDAMAIADRIKIAGLEDVARKMAEDLVAAGDAALAKNAEDGHAHYARAVALRRLERWPEAMREYGAAARLFPDDAQVQYENGEYLSERSRWGKAQAALEAATRLDPGHVRAYRMLGWVFKQQNQPAEAEKALRAAIALAPSHGDTWTLLGTVYAIQNKNDAGIAAYKKAQRLGSYKPEVFQNLGQLYFRKKDWRAAAAISEEGQALYPDEASFPASIGAAYLETKEYARSAAASRRAIMLNDGHAIAHHNLGMALLGLGRRAEARPELERGLAIGGPPEMVNEARAMLAKFPG